MPWSIASCGPETDLLAVDADRAAVELVGAEDRPRGLGPPRADEPGEAEDLALMSAQRDVDELDGMRIARRCGGG